MCVPCRHVTSVCAYVCVACWHVAGVRVRVLVCVRVYLDAVQVCQQSETEVWCGVRCVRCANSQRRCGVVWCEVCVRCV